MRRAGRIVARRHGAVGPEKNRAGMPDVPERGLRISRVDREVLGREFIGQVSRFVITVRHHDRAKPLEAVAGEIAPLEHRQPPVERLGHSVGQRGARGEQDRGARGVLRLCEHVGGDVFGIADRIGNDHDLARAGDRVDRDVAVDMFLGECHEEVAGADDLVDPRQPFHAVGHRGHGLRASGPHHGCHAQFVAGRQHVDVF